MKAILRARDERTEMERGIRDVGTYIVHCSCANAVDDPLYDHHYALDHHHCG